MPTDLSFYIRAAAQLADRIIDETKLAITAAALNLTQYGGIYWQTLFESIDGFSVSDQVSLTSLRVIIATTATQTNEQYLYKSPQYLIVPQSWDKNSRFKTRVCFSTVTSQLVYLVVGPGGIPTKKWVGFKVVDDQLYGCVSDGSTETLTDALQTLSAGDAPVLECSFTAGTKCEFFVDGIGKGSITSGLPSGDVAAGDECVLFAYVKTTGDESKEIQLSEWRFLQEP